MTTFVWQMACSTYKVSSGKKEERLSRLKQTVENVRFIISLNPESLLLLTGCHHGYLRLPLWQMRTKKYQNWKFCIVIRKRNIKTITQSNQTNQSPQTARRWRGRRALFSFVPIGQSFPPPFYFWVCYPITLCQRTTALPQRTSTRAKRALRRKLN